MMKSKMIFRIVFTGFFAFAIAACNKKFKHEKYDSVQAADCELCDYAESLEGNYRASAFDKFFMENDSMTASLEHVFLNHGNALDSTVMYFKMTQVFDNHGTRIKTISINNDQGIFYKDPTWTGAGTFIFNDTLHIKEVVTGKYPYIKFEFHGKKIP